MRRSPNPIAAGDRFGRLVVQEVLPSEKGPSGRGKGYRARCSCDCGASLITHKQSLLAGRTRSCGCLQRDIVRTANRTHGNTPRIGRTPEYKAWANLKDRCLNKNAHNYERYGGRGITVCARWDVFVNFLAPRPGLGYSIDRIDNNGPYCKENCRWATSRQQSVNKRSNSKLEYQGESMTIREWSERLGIPFHRLRWRKSKGLAASEILTTTVPKGEEK